MRTSRISIAGRVTACFLSGLFLLLSFTEIDASLGAKDGPGNANAAVLIPEGEQDTGKETGSLKEEVSKKNIDLFSFTHLQASLAELAVLGKKGCHTDPGRVSNLPADKVTPPPEV